MPQVLSSKNLTPEAIAHIISDASPSHGIQVIRS